MYQEIRAYATAKEAKVHVRYKRTPKYLLDDRDSRQSTKQRSWKKYRKTRWKT